MNVIMCDSSRRQLKCDLTAITAESDREGGDGGAMVSV